MSQSSERPEKDLRREWERRLESEGLGAIDDKSIGRRGLKEGDGGPTLSSSSVYQYYSLARAHYHDGVFSTEKARQIWYWHTQGCSSREVAKRLKVSKNTVCKVVKQHFEQMMSGYGVAASATNAELKAKADSLVKELERLVSVPGYSEMALDAMDTAIIWAEAQQIPASPTRCRKYEGPEND